MILCVSRKYGNVRMRRMLGIDMQTLKEKLRREEEEEDVGKGAEEEGEEEEGDDGWANFYGDDKEVVYDSAEELSESEGEDEIGDDEEEGDENRIDGGGIEVEVGADEVGADEVSGEQDRGNREGKEDEDDSLPRLEDIGNGIPLPPPPPPVATAITADANENNIENLNPIDQPPDPPNTAIQIQAIESLEKTVGVQVMAMMLEKLHAPLLEGAFFNSDDLAGLMYETSTRTAVSKKVLETLQRVSARFGASAMGASATAGLAWDELGGSERDKLLDVLVHDDSGTRLDLLSSDLNKLGSLPMWETLSGSYVALGSNNIVNSTASPGSVNDNYTLGGELKFEEVVEVSLRKS